MATAQRHDQESIPEVGRAVIDDIRRMAQLEIELAKAQAIATAWQLAVEIALFAVAAILVLFGLAYSLLAISEGVGLLEHFWGWLVSGAVVILVASLLALIGAWRLKHTIARTKTTIGDIKGDAEWLKQLPRRGSSSS